MAKSATAKKPASKKTSKPAAKKTSAGQASSKKPAKKKTAPKKRNLCARVAAQPAPFPIPLTWFKKLIGIFRLPIC